MQSTSEVRLRKHGDYQRVYRQGRKHSSASMTYFFAPRSAGSRTGPRVGLTAGRALGKAVERNRIKRRMREAIRLSLACLTRDVDLVLHPRRAVLTADFPRLRGEVAQVFSIVEKAASPKKEKSAKMDECRAAEGDR